MTSAESHPLQVALVGYGFAGKTFHAPILSAVEGMKLTHIVSSDPGKVRRDWPGVTTVSGIDDVCAIRSIDLIVIATPKRDEAAVAVIEMEVSSEVRRVRFTVESAIPPPLLIRQKNPPA